tara:strand:+ start:974 stop:2503 length:1530 start_codon:yes stop_codon:yes gene_type:complete
MSKCFYIGIGGTGSKCVDNYVYSCAAGLGPENLWLGMVDQDEGNGNVERSSINIEQYQKVRKILRTPGLSDINSKTNLFKTNITTFPEHSNWPPLKSSGTTKPTLKNIFKFNALKDEIQDIMSSLYHSEEELTLELDEGFRGRPSIGSAAILSRIHENEPFWQNIFNAIDAAQQGHIVKIFLVSSIFGGTGASGFPSIARLLRRILELRGIKDNVYIGGALLLPYFSFPKPPEDEKGIVAYSDSFLEQTRGALDYYGRLFDEKNYQKTFDQLYVVGWDPLIQLKTFAKGGPNQDNPPLLPEMFASLAASKFFSDDVIEDGIYHIAREDEKSFNWQDFPNINNKSNNYVKESIAQFTRTAIAFKEIYFPFLTDKWTKVKNESWIRKTILKQGIDLNEENNKLNLTTILRYFESYLEWLATMIHHSSEATNKNINLVDVNQFSQFDDSLEGEGVVLNKKLNEQQLKQFGNIIYDSKLNNLSQVFLKMNYAKIPKNRVGLGAFMGALYDSCK